MLSSICNILLFVISYDGAPALMSDRYTANGVATAYVCRDSTCDLPTTDSAEKARQLRHAVRRTH